MRLRSSLHLIATLENSTLRHFDLNLQRQVSLHLLLKDSNLADCGRFDALELGAVEELVAVFETRFNVGLDFTIVISSPVPSCIHFDIV